MSVRERILTIRLMEKMNANPAYAEAFSIVAKTNQLNLSGRDASNSANNK